MRRERAIIEGLISGKATISPVKKIRIKKTPGDVTEECKHQ